MNHLKTHAQEADNKAFIMGVGVASTSLQVVLSRIDEICKNSHNSLVDGPYFIVTVNPEFIMEARSDSAFKKILNSADLAIPDGVGLRLAKPDLTIIPGRKIVQALVESKKYKIFYLGAGDGVAKAMATKYGGQGDAGHEDIKSQISNLKVNEKIIKIINSFNPDILLVAYGAPWQEKWIWANKGQLNAKVVMGVGGSFDYLTGVAALPPVWMEKTGLEWLWRLIRQPGRWKRQLSWVKFALLTLTGF